MNRWLERRELVVEQLGKLRPDILALNEIDIQLETARWLQRTAREGLELSYTLLQHSQVNSLSEIGGQALLTRFPVIESANLDYRSRDRVTQVARIAIGGTRMDVYVSHLQAGDGEELVRRLQVQRLLRWIDSRDDVEVRVVCGDFNAVLESPSIREMAKRFQSVQSRPTASTLLTLPEERPPGWELLTRCIDYIWVDGPAAVRDAGVCFDRPGQNDPSLWPSDHLGVWADLELPGA
jgi:endonuclease/exonuclease/phosphatase family metal-dependent hydrolase